MAHDISMTGDHAHMAYVGRVPWHRLGTELPAGTTAADAARVARLDWTVRRKGLAVIDHNGAHNVRDHAMLVRTDDNGSGEAAPRMLAIAGADCEPLQNEEVIRVADPLIARGDACFDTAGALGNGERVWFLLRLIGYDREVARNDTIEMYLLIANRFDQGHVEARLTPVRVVCNNTLSMAELFGSGLRLPHRVGAGRQLNRAADVLTNIGSSCEKLTLLLTRMADTSITDEQIDRLILATFPDPTDWGDEQARARVEESRRIARFLVDAGTGNELPGVAGTVWAAINGVTQYLDHRRMDRAERLDSAWFGDAYTAKMRTVNHAIRLVTNGDDDAETQSARDARRRRMMADALAVANLTRSIRVPVARLAD